MKIKGIINWVKRDAETLQVIDEFEVTNVITDYALRELIVNKYHFGDSIGISNDVLVADRKDNIMPSAYEIGHTEVGVTSPETFQRDVAGGIPAYAQWQQRFNQPASTRTINTIFLSRSVATTNNACSCYVALSSPCVQNTNEILDVFYRIQFLEDYSENITTHALDAVIDALAHDSYTNFPDTLFASWTGHSVRGDYFDINNDDRDRVDYVYMKGDNPTASSQALMTKTDDEANFAQHFNWDFQRSYNYDATPVIGRIFGGMSFHGEENLPTIASFKMLDDIDSRIQPVFFHNSEATGPFQNVNTLSTGYGQLQTSGSWVDQELPESYRVDIVKTGITGVGEYSFSKIDFIGWDDNSYGGRRAGNPFRASHYEPYEKLTIANGHGITQRPDTAGNLEFINDSEIVSWDPTGITIQNQFTGDYENYDAQSTPALPVTGVQQVSYTKTDTNFIWVASANEGLFKINRSGGTVDKIVFAEGYINSDNCFAVSYGNAGKVWALMRGALVATADDGLTWTVYHTASGVPFSHPELIAQDYENVFYMRVDPDSASDQMLFVLLDKVVWWSTEGEAFDGVELESVTNVATLYEDSPSKLPNSIVVTDVGSIWVMNLNHSTYGGYVYFSKWRDSETKIGTRNNSFLSVVGPNYMAPARIIYDRIGNPLLQYEESIYTLNNSIFGVASGVDAPITLYRSYYDFGGMARQASLSSRGWMMQDGLISNVLQESGAPANNGLLRNLVWDDYGWNGVSWEKDYYGTDPVELLGNFRAIHRGFEGNTWTFNGATSAIELRYTAPNSNARNATVQGIAFSATSAQIEEAGVQKYIFDAWPNRFSICWHSPTTSGQIAIRIDDTFYDVGARPIDGLKHRYIVLWDYTQQNIEVYIDGNLLGSIPQTVKPFGSFASCAVGNSASTIGLTSNYGFEGNIENFQIFSEVPTSTMITADSANMADPGYNMFNSFAFDEDLNNDLIVGSTLVDQGGGTYTISSSSSWDKYILSVAGADVIEAQFVTGGTWYYPNSRNAIGFQSDATWSASQSLDSVFEYAIFAQNDHTEHLIHIQGQTPISLGVWPVDDPTFRIEKSGTDVLFYVEGLLVHTHDASNDSKLSDRSGLIKCEYNVRSTDLYFANVTMYWSRSVGPLSRIAHIPMNDVLSSSGHKTTHIANEELLHGISLSFEDNPTESLQWISGDHYTFAACEGFLKDNIRTLSGEYNFYFKPIELELSDFTPSVVPVGNATLESMYSGVSGEGTIILGDPIAETGVYNVNSFTRIESHSVHGTELFADGSELMIRKDLVAYSDNDSIVGVSFIRYGQYDWLPNFATGDEVVIQLDDGTWSTHTLTYWGTRYFGISPLIDPARYIPKFGWIVKTEVPIQGEVFVYPDMGFIRLNPADIGKTITGKYSSIFEG